MLSRLFTYRSLSSALSQERFTDSSAFLLPHSFTAIFFIWFPILYLFCFWGLYYFSSMRRLAPLFFSVHTSGRIFWYGFLPGRPIISAPVGSYMHWRSFWFFLGSSDVTLFRFSSRQLFYCCTVESFTAYYPVTHVCLGNLILLAAWLG